MANTLETSVVRSRGEGGGAEAGEGGGGLARGAAHGLRWVRGAGCTPARVAKFNSSALNGSRGGEQES